MRRDFRHFELPAAFARMCRPVRVHLHEKGLAAFVLDDYGIRFFRLMATATPVPTEAIWSLVGHVAGTRCLQLVFGRHQDAAGYVVCEVPHASGDAATYTVPPRLSYRAKVTIAALQNLLSDLSNDPAVSAVADVTGIIERRIEQLRS
jgi:hypothetical protein